MVKEKIFGDQLICLPDIFRNHFFTVPDYQRSYAWDERQVEELLNDLGHLIDEGSALRHYTGTLVLSRVTNAKIDHEYHVVDGQQRLTTMVIVLRVLAEHLPDVEKPDFISLYIRRGEIGSDRPVLRLNSDTRLFFERVIIDNLSSSNELMNFEACDRLLKARGLVAKWIDERLKKDISIEQIRKTLELNFGFLVYAPKEDAETGIMFEVINNRGKPLSELEKVKNYLIYCSVKLGAHTIRERIDEIWSDILRNLNAAKKTSPSDESAFLRYCMVVYFELNKSDSQNGYEEIKKRLPIKYSLKDNRQKNLVLQKISNFVDFMKLAALWYARLYGQCHDGVSRDLIPILEQIRGQIRHASIMPIFLALVIRNGGQGETLGRLLSLLELINFRVYMSRNITKRNDSGQGTLYAFASDYFHEKLLMQMPVEERKLRNGRLDNDHKALEYRLVEFALWHAPDSLFESSLKLEKDSNDDFFYWGGLRYFLMNYEQELQPKKTIQIDKITTARSDGRSADYLSIEHVWATENRNSPGVNDRAIDRFEKRRLGNFVLLELRLNIKAGDKDLEEKIKHYQGKEDEPATDLQQVRRMAGDAKNVLRLLSARTRSKNYYLELHRKVNDLVEKRLTDFALKRWALKGFIGYTELKRRIQEESTEETL